MFPGFSGIELLDERLGRMKALGDELQQRRVRKPFQPRLLSVAAWHVSDQFKILFSDCVGRVSHRNLIKHPLIDCAGLWHRMRVFV
ncbi:MAG: hypothetical protein DMC60_03455 [Verrucomicrobia bacterium]|nr:MAG: hypothetical protein DMC60_03455 [Verrucomicrobiota bacterium]